MSVGVSLSCIEAFEDIGRPRRSERVQRSKDLVIRCRVDARTLRPSRIASSVCWLSPVRRIEEKVSGCRTARFNTSRSPRVMTVRAVRPLAALSSS